VLATSASAHTLALLNPCIIAVLTPELGR